MRRRAPTATPSTPRAGVARLGRDERRAGQKTQKRVVVAETHLKRDLKRSARSRYGDDDSNGSSVHHSRTLDRSRRARRGWILRLRAGPRRRGARARAAARSIPARPRGRTRIDAASRRDERGASASVALGSVRASRGPAPLIGSARPRRARRKSANRCHPGTAAGARRPRAPPGPPRPGRGGAPLRGPGRLPAPRGAGVGLRLRPGVPAAPAPRAGASVARASVPAEPAGAAPPLRAPRAARAPAAAPSALPAALPPPSARAAAPAHAPELGRGVPHEGRQRRFLRHGLRRRRGGGRRRDEIGRRPKRGRERRDVRRPDPERVPRGLLQGRLELRRAAGDERVHGRRARRRAPVAPRDGARGLSREESRLPLERVRRLVRVEGRHHHGPERVAGGPGAVRGDDRGDFPGAARERELDRGPGPGVGRRRVGRLRPHHRPLPARGVVRHRPVPRVVQRRPRVVRPRDDVLGREAVGEGVPGPVLGERHAGAELGTGAAKKSHPRLRGETPGEDHRRVPARAVGAREDRVRAADQSPRAG